MNILDCDEDKYYPFKLDTKNSYYGGGFVKFRDNETQAFKKCYDQLLIETSEGFNTPKGYSIEFMVLPSVYIASDPQRQRGYVAWRFKKTEY